MEFFALDVEGEKEAVAASVDVPLDSSNVGFRLLKKMGWKENTGLGRDGSGKSVAEHHWLGQVGTGSSRFESRWLPGVNGDRCPTVTRCDMWCVL